MYKKRVGIIPGHGGFDPGAINSTYGTRESNSNLAVGLYLKELLEYMDFEVCISRTNDIACGGAKTETQDINNQIAWANSINADIIVSIHFNSSADKSASGVEVLYAHSADTREVMLALQLQKEIVEATRLRSRGIKKEDKRIGLIRRVVKIPCVLTECAFISNDAESVWASNPEKQWILAQAHAKAICYFFGKEYIDMKKINIVDGNKKLITTGFLINNISYIPVRAIGESLGATVEWNGTTTPPTVIVRKKA